MKRFKLSNTELDTMLVLWECRAPIRASALLERMKPTYPWSISTLQTILSRLEEKGAVSVQVNKRTRYFYPSVTKEEYVAQETGSLMERIQGYSPVTLMAGLIRSGQIRESDFREIELLLQQAREDSKNSK